MGFNLIYFEIFGHPPEGAWKLFHNWVHQTFRPNNRKKVFSFLFNRMVKFLLVLLPIGSWIDVCIVKDWGNKNTSTKFSQEAQEDATWLTITHLRNIWKVDEPRFSFISQCSKQNVQLLRPTYTFCRVNYTIRWLRHKY